MYAAGFLSAFSKTNDYIISEESSQSIDTLSYDRFWLIDPIDGTRAFVIGNPTWSNLISLNYKGKPIFGLANFPKLKKYYYNTSVDKAYVVENNKKIKSNDKIIFVVVEFVIKLACSQPFFFTDVFIIRISSSSSCVPAIAEFLLSNRTPSMTKEYSIPYKVANPFNFVNVLFAGINNTGEVLLLRLLLWILPWFIL